jgi:hypothetical protein
MIVTETGCIIHKLGGEYAGQEDGYAIFKCPVCGEVVSREAEDCGSGC